MCTSSEFQRYNNMVKTKYFFIYNKIEAQIYTVMILLTKLYHVKEHG